VFVTNGVQLDPLDYPHTESIMLHAKLYRKGKFKSNDANLSFPYLWVDLDAGEVAHARYGYHREHIQKYQIRVEATRPLPISTLKPLDIGMKRPKNK